jgi:glutamate/tyrosine decarboxylase-like PLP-dependent enzyme
VVSVVIAHLAKPFPGLTTDQACPVGSGVDKQLVEQIIAAVIGLLQAHVRAIGRQPAHVPQGLAVALISQPDAGRAPFLAQANRCEHRVRRFLTSAGELSVVRNLANGILIAALDRGEPGKEERHNDEDGHGSGDIRPRPDSPALLGHGAIFAHPERVASAGVDDVSAVLHRAAAAAADYRATLPTRRVAPSEDLSTLRAEFGGSLGTSPTPPDLVIEELVKAAEGGLMATAGPRFFGFVIGGSLPAAAAADMLATGWDQVAFNTVTSPAAAAAEHAAGEWLKELLGIPATASVGFVTGAQAGNTVGLAAARHHVLAEVGWDVERDGLRGAPPVRVIAGVERHATVDRSLRLLGFGTAEMAVVRADANGAIDPADLARVLDTGPNAPTIVCLQSGNVNTGACDDLRTACELAHAHGAWVHVDGAFGLWAGASPTTRHLVDGVELADSWVTDGHKWLNVPYDSGFVFCAQPAAHVAAVAYTADYLVGSGSAVVGPADLVLESSRRARGFAVWAALRQLGRDGVADLVDRCCALARGFATRLAAGGVEIVNDVVLNQVLVGFGDDARTDRVIAAIQRDGTCWMGGTTWRGRRLMRISVSNWSTTEADVDRSVEAILRLAAQG